MLWPGEKTFFASRRVWNRSPNFALLSFTSAAWRPVRREGGRHSSPSTGEIRRRPSPWRSQGLRSAAPGSSSGGLCDTHRVLSCPPLWKSLSGLGVCFKIPGAPVSSYTLSHGASPLAAPGPGLGLSVVHKWGRLCPRLGEGVWTIRRESQGIPGAPESPIPKHPTAPF